MELAILLVALVVTLAVCFVALRLLAYEFDCVCSRAPMGVSVRSVYIRNWLI